MKVVSLQGLDQYDIYEQDFTYEDTRLFAFHDKRDFSNEDHHQIEYGFYKGVLLHDSCVETYETYYFPEKNVFRLSENGYNATLYYLNYGDNYKSSDEQKSVSLHKLNCRTNDTTLVSIRNFNSPDIASKEGFMYDLTFVGIDERYVFLSFYLGEERVKHYYVIDSSTGEWIPFAPDPMLNALEYFSILGNDQFPYIVIKTGQYFSEEKKRWWVNNSIDNVDEHLVVIKAAEFVELARRGSLDLRPYVIHTCGNNSAFAGYIFDSNEIVYYTIHFDRSTTSIIRYNPLTFDKESLSFDGIHDFIRCIYNKYYSIISPGSDQKTTLYILNTMEEVVTIYPPEKFVWLDGENVLTFTFLPNGNTRLTSKNIVTNHEIILGEGICYLDLDRDVVTLIERAGN